MKVVAKMFLVAVLMAGFFVGCAGPMRITHSGVEGSTYDPKMVEAASKANVWADYSRNPAAFDYKCPFDPTDRRNTYIRVDRKENASSSGNGLTPEEQKVYSGFFKKKK